MSTQQEPSHGVSLALVQQIEGMDRYLREAIQCLKDALLIQLKGTRERGSNRAVRRLPPAPAGAPPTVLIPVLTGYTQLARLVAALFSLAANMAEAQQIFGYFRRAIESVQEEEAEGRRQRQELGDDRHETDMEQCGGTREHHGRSIIFGISPHPMSHRIRME